jgi:hypothetical protein
LMPIMIFMTRYYNISNHSRRFVSVSKNFFKIFRLTLFALIVFITSSCEKGVLDMGSGLLPESDYVSVKSIDTLSVFSYTMYKNSIRSDNPAISYLGQVFDPYFGTTTAEFVTQLRLVAPWTDKKFTMDSVKLFLHLLSTKGKADVIHTLKLSEISDLISPDSTYYSNTPVHTTGYVVNNIELPVLRTDTINDVILNLPVEFGNYLTRDPTQLFYSENNIHYSPAFPDFRSYFKGLYFQMEPSSDPVLVSLYLEPPNVNNSEHSGSTSALVLYYRDSTDVSRQFELLLDAKIRNAAYSRFSHDYLTADPDKRIKHINDGYRDTLSYLQSLNGVYTKIVLPGLAKIKNDASLGKIAVNRAKLIVPVVFDGNQFTGTTVPSRLVLKYQTADGSSFVVPDWNIESTYQTFYDGRVDTTARVYNFNIPAFVQAYLSDATNNVEPELSIYEEGGINNVILKTDKNKTPIKFEFTYTKF